jgi:hypothetical protein
MLYSNARTASQEEISLIDDLLRFLLILLLLLLLDTRRHDSFHIYYGGKSGWTPWPTRLTYSLKGAIRWRNSPIEAGLVI